MAVLVLFFGLFHKYLNADTRVIGLPTSEYLNAANPPLPKIHEIPSDLRINLAKLYIQNNIEIVVAEANEILQGEPGYEHILIEEVESSPNAILDWYGGYEFDYKTQSLLNRLNISVVEEIGPDALVLSISMPFIIKVHPVDGAVSHQWLPEQTESLMEGECGLSDLDPQLEPNLKLTTASTLGQEVLVTCNSVRESLNLNWEEVSTSIARGLRRRYVVETSHLDRLMGELVEVHIDEHLRLTRMFRAKLNHGLELPVYFETVIRFGPEQVSETVDVQILLVAIVSKDFRVVPGTIELLDAQFNLPYESTIARCSASRCGRSPFDLQV